MGNNVNLEVTRRAVAYIEAIKGMKNLLEGSVNNVTLLDIILLVILQPFCSA